MRRSLRGTLLKIICYPRHRKHIFPRSRRRQIFAAAPPVETGCRGLGFTTPAKTAKKMALMKPICLWAGVLLTLLLGSPAGAQNYSISSSVFAGINRPPQRQHREQGNEAEQGTREVIEAILQVVLQAHEHDVKILFHRDDG